MLRKLADRARRFLRAARLLAMLAIAFAVTAAGTTHAGTGSRASLPAGPKVKNGLRVNIDTTWVDANGYRPVQIELIPWPPGPAPADRTIRVDFKPQSWRGGYGWCGVSDFIEIPQGAASVDAVIRVPQREQWNSFLLEFYEDGEKLEDLEYSGAMTFMGNHGWSEASPAMLFIDGDAPPRVLRQQRIADLRSAGADAEDDSSTLPDPRGLVEMHPPPDLTQFGYNPDEPATDLTVLDSLGKWSKVELLPPSDLPKQWNDYSAFDLIFASLGDLQAMAREQPEKWQAVRDWLSTGTTLCIYDVGEDFARLQEVEELLEAAPFSDAEAGAKYRGWRQPDPKHYTRELLRVRPAYANQYWQRQQQQAQREAVSDKIKQALEAAEGKPPATPNFVWRQVGLGRVAALSAENPFPGRPQDWGWLLNTIDSSDWMWYRRHGVSLNRRNLDYWNFLIPGVGLAPVSTFLVLISLFVVVIGPINYWFLVRQGRLYLLLVTVPAGALAITFSLFGYALVTDGLGVKARLRSYTEIDQRRDRSVSWSRQSYYAGITPSGLEYPKTAAVYPIEVEPSARPNFYDNKHFIDWEYNQSLSRGYIASRVTSQMMVVQAQGTLAEVVVNEAAGGAPRATNQLRADVEFLVVCDSHGKYYAAEDLATGETVTLSPIVSTDATDRLQKALSDARPANPPGYDPREHNEALDFGNNRYNWWGGNVDSDLAEPNLSSSVLERALRRATSLDPNYITPKSWVALAPHSPQVPLAVEEPEQFKSLHVVVGKW